MTDNTETETKYNEDDLEAYDFYKEATLLNLGCDIIDYTRNNSPKLLNYKDSLYNIMEILKYHIDIPNIFNNSIEISSEDDDDEIYYNN